MVLLLSGGLFLGERSVIALSTPTAASVNLRASATEKVSAKVRAMAQGGGFLPVFVVLRSQPHREILERHESASRLKLDILEERYLQLQRQTFAAEAELQGAKVALEEAALQTRQAAFKEIQAEIGPGQEAIALLLTQLGAKNIQRYSAINMLAADVPALALGSLAADSSVVEVAPIETHSAQLAVSVPSLGAPAFWSAGYAGASESVAVLDTGVRTSHPAFSGLNIVSKVFLDHGKQDPCFADDATSPEDKEGHGTHVAGIVASRAAPGWSGYWGVARGLGTLYNLKIAYLNKCSGRGTSNDEDVMNALQWAVEQAPWVKAFNYSYGRDTSTDDDGLARRFDYLADTYGLIISVAAGNESKSGFLGLWTNPGPLSSPGIGYNVITVAAMNTQGTIDRSDDEIAIFSSRGPTAGGRKKPDIAAPGGLLDTWSLSGWQADRGIYSAAYNSDGFVPKPGTSMAAPHIAGSAALLRQAGVRDPLAIKALLLNTTDSLNWRSDQGWGYANLTRVFAQRDGALTSTLSSGGVRLYKGLANGLFYSTLTWNRSVFQTLAGGCLSNLDLFLYNGSSGALLSSSTSSTDNVEKAYTTSYGPLVVNVAHWSAGSCRSPETFGVGFSEAGFQSAAGPVLNVSCTAPAAVAPSAQFSAACTITNRGDLPALSVQGALAFAGSTSSSSQDFGTIPSAGSSTKTWLVTAPASIGTFTLQLAAQSDSFGGRFSGSASMTFSSTTGACTIAVSPTTLTFGANQGSNPPAQSFTVNSSGGCALAWTASVSTSSGGNWLSVVPTSGTAGSSVQVIVNSTGLAGGTYAGTISVASTTAGVTNSPQTVSVTLAVLSTTPVIALSASSLTFWAVPGGAAPPPQSVSLTNSGAGALAWAASATTTSGGNWLSVTPASGAAPGTLSVAANPTGLGAGRYLGAITVVSTGAAATPQTIAVELLVAAPKINSPGGVTNAATAGTYGISPGGLISIYGTNMATAVSAAVSFPLPDQLGTTVLKTGPFRAKLLYVSPTQINAQVPIELTSTSAQVIVSASGVDSDPVALSVLPFDPGLFTTTSQPGGPAAALRASDYKLITPTSPAARGSAIILYGTGMGAVSPSVVSGQPGSTQEPLNRTVGTPEVQIGGRPAQVLFSGLAPGFAGLYQLNVIIPSDAPPGDGVPVVVGIGGRGSNAATLAVR
jgi:uncharacterized protein (TIGR03437 family)